MSTMIRILLMHKVKDFSIDPRTLTSDLLEEREWKKRALLDVLANDVFTNINLSRIALDWDLSSWKLDFSDSELAIRFKSSIMFKRGRSDAKRLRRSINLCCSCFTKMDPVHMWFESNFHMNCLEVLEDLIEFMINNTINYDTGPITIREVRLWEKWSSLEEIYLKARL